MERFKSAVLAFAVLVLLCVAILADASDAPAQSIASGHLDPDMLLRAITAALIAAVLYNIRQDRKSAAKSLELQAEATEKTFNLHADMLADLYKKWNGSRDEQVRVCTEHDLAMEASLCPAMRYLARASVSRRGHARAGDADRHAHLRGDDPEDAVGEE